LKPDDLQYMNKAYLLIGGNMGDRQQNLDRSVQLLGSLGKVRELSGLYETAAWGKTDQPAFLNQAIFLETALTARELLQAVLDIEEKLGRKRDEKYGPRIIDIDILFYDRDIIHEPGLAIPHPEIQNRRFALAPMNEIAGGLIHPVLGKTIAELLNECPDKLNVTRVK
jgi:2-amino-4-hydroxy-6-hydroxymethyldihydropteridine diphosphokinase